MSPTATVRVMSPEEITARAGGQTPYLHLPQRGSVFAERAMRLRQLTPGHAMEDFLRFMADLALAQQRQLTALDGSGRLPGPDAAALDLAARRGLPPLPAADSPRDAAWQGVLQALVADLSASAPPGVQPVLARLAGADADFLERQADALLHGVPARLDLACAPLLAAALQVCFTHQMLQTQQHAGSGQPFGRLDDPTRCPCCGSLPVASITRTAGDAPGQRYLHCGLCNLQWHMVRIQCAHCLSTQSLAYQSLDTAGPDGQGEEGAGSSRAAQAVLQAETCDDCGHYLKIMHSDRDPFVDPVADDLASLTLDLLVSDTGLARHGVNLLLLFGEPDPGGAPPDPGGA
jgi:FdhE protein